MREMLESTPTWSKTEKLEENYRDLMSSIFFNALDLGIIAQEPAIGNLARDIIVMLRLR